MTLYCNLGVVIHVLLSVVVSKTSKAQSDRDLAGHVQKCWPSPSLTSHPGQHTT